MNILILGAFGQDAFYFAKKLEINNNKIFLSYIRKKKVPKYNNLNKDRHKLIKLNLNNQEIIQKFIYLEKINLVINLIASYSSNTDELYKINYKYNCNILNAIKTVNKDIKYVYASSSSIFGNKKILSSKVYNPTTNYAKSKLKAHLFNINMRKLYKIDIYNLILFNHYSLIQKKNFLFPKIYFFCSKLVNKNRIFRPLEIGNIFSERDWSHANDIAKSSIKIVDNKRPGDYFVNSGYKINVKNIICSILNNFNVEYYFKKNNFYLKRNQKKIFIINKKYIRKNDYEVNSISSNKYIKNNPYRHNHLFIEDVLKDIKSI